MYQTEYMLKKIKHMKKHHRKHFHDQIHNCFMEWYCSNISNTKYENTIQYGGIRSTKLIKQYNGYKFRIEIDEYTDVIIIHILSHKTVSPDMCGIIEIDKKTGLTILQNMSNYKECTIPDLINKGGTVILNFILGFLKENKKTLGVKRIILKDNSMKTCNNCPDNIHLGDMYMLLYGNTWYGKYGFKPYNPQKNIPDITLLEEYLNNQKIINKIKVRDVNLLTYINDAIKKYQIKNYNFHNIFKCIDDWQNKSLSKVLKILLIDYDNNCCVFNYMIRQIYKHFGLYSFNRHTFYLDII